MKTTQLMRKALRFGLASAILLAAKAWALPTDIAQQPLALPAANVPPNIMMILDDSGSMIQQYTPDYLGRHFGGSNRLCLDSRDDNGSIDSNLDNCEAGDPPLMTPDLNTQYYNPEIRYLPAVNYDGTSKGSMDAARTDNWLEVPTDGVSPSTQNAFRKDTYDMNGGGGTVSLVDLVHNYPDRVWCKSQSASATGGNCRVNGTYTYPDNTYSYGLDTSGNVKYITGSPYYYRIIPTVFCTDQTLIVCNRQPAATLTYPVPAPVRYCDSTALDNCQAKYQGSFTRPEYTGFVTSASSTASQATATLTVKNPQSDNQSGTITGIYVKGVNIIGTTTVSAIGPINALTAATAIRDAINNETGTNGGYTATVSNNVVTITAPASCVTNLDCSTWNASSVIVQSPGTPVTPATDTFTVSSVSSNDYVSSMTVNGVALISSTVTCLSSAGCTASVGRDIWMAGQLAAAINAGGSGYTASASGADLTITAPAGTGSEYNGLTLRTRPRFGSYVVNAGNNTTFGGGVTSGDIETSTISFTGGVDPNNGRLNVGDFVRTNITPYQDPPTNSVPNTFPKAPGRTDCTGTRCTYDEEMTNFANWYAYYRTRDTMAKTAIGRAFLSLTSQYRVGFITINPGSPVQSDRYLKVDDFAGGAGNQKDLWYQEVYGTGSNGSTPLREALSRVGRYYANVTSGINNGMDASPIQYSCQPNYTILMTDGYWNGSQGEDLSGNAIGNQDNVNAGYSTRAVGAYDGGLSGSTNTLADVAMYYYKTDLRTDLNNNVPTTQKDTASFQHMTTFTVGLGLAGQLNYDPNYESATSGDFWDIKQGAKNWPVPAADSETALDDLWHAAVNGRGTFFSAKNPVDLANSLTETINSLQSRVGAGAAAATSNLQPVAGDNFAFTAQYQTVEWSGDLEARTIDLSTGFVAYRQLWSAQSQLDQRTAGDRYIYTYDPTDNSAPSTGNGNKLKAFCWTTAYSTSPALYPACGGEPGLDATEMSYFDPLTLPQAVPWPTDGSGRDTSASAQNLVDYLRGDTSNESLGGTATTDLYRNRVHLLGDIVDAQPAYVKAAPFEYDSGSYIGIDPYYQDFKKLTDGTNATRKGTVFAASNDGMLHAFETDPDNNPYFQTAGISTAVTSDDTFTGTLDTNPITGEGAERWAYIPSMVLPRLKDLASIPYTHEYYVDGSPAVGDVCFGHTTSTPCAAITNWHTILVAGLNAGGRGYYALDVTDPDNPKALWELKGGSGTTCQTDADIAAGGKTEDCNIGYTFGNPIITKRMSDGKWVVYVTSGYNNIAPGDGKGYLYEIDAQTGVILHRIGTGVGCDGITITASCPTPGNFDPSGLARINAWVDASFYNNTTQRIYGGDLKGNVWRFQLDPGASGYLTAQRITTLTDGTNPQPITTRPELGLINNYPVIFVATGQLLGTSDTTTTQVQSVYAFMDDLTGTPITIRGNPAYVQQMLTSSGPDTRTVTSNAVDWTTNKGWYADLPDTGERVNVDPVLQLGTLIVPSNVPSSDTCTAGGSGWINFFDYRTGSYVTGATDNMVSTKIGASLVVGVNVVQLPGGAVKTIVTTADNQQLTQETPVSPPAIQGRRVSWRELIRE